MICLQLKMFRLFFVKYLINAIYVCILSNLSACLFLRHCQWLRLCLCLSVLLLLLRTLHKHLSLVITYLDVADYRITNGVVFGLREVQYHLVQCGFCQALFFVYIRWKILSYMGGGEIANLIM
jgi:hypothetical protein